MLENIFSQYYYLAPLVLRLALGVILIRHGWPKLKSESLKNFSGWLGSMGFPLPMFCAVIVAVVEFFGGIALILGLLTFWVALLIVIEFLVILLIVNRTKPFAEKEFDMLILAVALVLMFLGSGYYSLETLLSVLIIIYNSGTF